MKCVIYARVSTENQDTENQTEVLKRWVKAQNMELVAVYTESESAWKEGKQRELRRLMDSAYKRKFDIVVVWALDRLTREGISTILRIYHRFLQFGVRVYSYQESWTATSNEFTELMLSITGWVANFESNRKSKRVKAALVRLKAHGVRLGRPPGSVDKKTRKRRVKIYDN